MSAYDKALYFLSSREHTEKELKTKLSAKGYRQEEIEEALERLKKENALSEERFAELYIRSRLRKSPEGKSILMMRLLEKGSPRDVASASLSEVWENEEYLEPLKEALHSYEQKKGRDYADGKMIQKGFSLREIEMARALADE